MKTRALLLALLMPNILSATELSGPAPRPAYSGNTSLANLQCAGCHRAIAEEWRKSLHHNAYVNSYFSRAVKIEAVNFCRKCHAPDADPSRDPPPPVASDGVSCLSCHWTSQGIVGSHGIGDAVAPNHFRAGDNRFSDDRACANCHEFDFPSGANNPVMTAMQSTVTEHKASRFSDRACQACHMPLVADSDGRQHRSHDFAVQGNQRLFAQAVSVKLVARHPSSITVELSTGAIGHAFPTGDLFRAAELRLWVSEPNGQVLSEARYRLERSYRSDLLHQTRRVLLDTRLVPKDGKDAKRTVELPLVAEAYKIHYSVSWQRMPEQLAVRLGLDPKAQSHVILEGVLAEP